MKERLIFLIMGIFFGCWITFKIIPMPEEATEVQLCDGCIDAEDYVMGQGFGEMAVDRE